MSKDKRKGKGKAKSQPGRDQCIRDAGLANVDAAAYVSVSMCEHGKYFLRLHRADGNVFACVVMPFEGGSWLSNYLGQLAMAHSQRMAQLKAASDRMGETKGSA